MQHTRLSDLDRRVVETAYARWAPVYDKVCGPIFETGRRSAASAALQVGGRILEVGVGTGLSFGDYDSSTEIVGIDLSEPMVAKARQRMASGLYPHVKAVMVMDAHQLAFEDESFDCVVAQFVITLVADPERVLSECARVLKPNGEIILVNHLYSERGMLAAIERWAARPTRIERRRVKPLGAYTLVRFRRVAEQAQAA
jgi:phosphatidylethanolamine/phosphatidyl-N-methylethanolamine N-methyltransferase